MNESLPPQPPPSAAPTKARRLAVAAAELITAKAVANPPYYMRMTAERDEEVFRNANLIEEAMTQAHAALLARCAALEEALKVYREVWGWARPHINDKKWRADLTGDIGKAETALAQTTPPPTDGGPS
jgi:hypothetical protein